MHEVRFTKDVWGANVNQEYKTLSSLQIFLTQFKEGVMEIDPFNPNSKVARSKKITANKVIK